MSQTTNSNLKRHPDWEAKDHWEGHVRWVHRGVTEVNLKQDEETREIIPDFKGSVDEKEYPGWYFQYGVSHSYLDDSYRDAVEHVFQNLLKSTLTEKVSHLEHIHLNKAERRTMALKAKVAFAEPVYDQKEHSLFWEFGDWGLIADVRHMPMRETIETAFEEENNPVRSLEGFSSRVEKMIWYSEEEAEPLAEGTLRVEGNTVFVGDWSQTFDPHDDCEGFAYATAFPYTDGIMVFRPQEKVTYVFFNLEQDPDDLD